MAKPKIPPELQALTLAKAAQGLSSEEIGAWLWREHKVEVHSSNVRRLLERDRSERADVAKGVVRTELRKHLLECIGRIDRIVLRAASIERAARERAAVLREGPDGHPNHPLAMEEDGLALKAMDRQLAALNKLMHYAGLNTADQAASVTQPQDARAALLGRLRTLLAAEVKNGAAEDPTLAN